MNETFQPDRLAGMTHHSEQCRFWRRLVTVIEVRVLLGALIALTFGHGDHVQFAVAQGASLSLNPSPGPAGSPFDFNIYLRNRVITPEPVIDRAFLDEIRSCAEPRTHAIVQLERLPHAVAPPGPGMAQVQDDIATLESLGVMLLGYLNGITGRGTAYLASISCQVQADDPRFDELVRAVVRLEATDKMEPAIFGDPGALSVLVLFFGDVTEQEAAQVFAENGLMAQLFAPPTLWQTTASHAQIAGLAAEDLVQWIEAGPPPFMPLLDVVRAVHNVDAVQGLDTASGAYSGLTGAGVQIAIMDTGVDNEHNDFAGRIIRSQDDNETHGSGVASIAAGSGFQSDKTDSLGTSNGGTPFQWRGMAPQAGIAAYGFAGGSAGIYNDAINQFGVDVSNHSYVLDCGRYSTTVQSVDSIIRGDSPGIPPRPQVWAAGNNGTGIQYCSILGYFSVFASCKNCITVGSINKDQIHSSFSSMGPTPDGRLKPDVSAAGHGARTVRSDNKFTTSPCCFWSPGGVANGYGGSSGTSAAAPTVTGIVALMLQQYTQTFGVNLGFAPPLPSTSKAILIQTATDLAGTDSDSSDNFTFRFDDACDCFILVPFLNPDTGQPVTYGVGPDWATGYGSVNAQAAVQMIKERRFLEGALNLSKVTDEFFVSVKPGQTQVRVTLAWDDIAGTPNANDAAPQLVNDLDLVLIEPNGTVHRPLVLPPLTPLDCDGNAANGLQFGTNLLHCALPNTGIDPVTQNDLGPAAEGLDRRNNVEQVVVQKDSGLAPGCWKVRVSVLNPDGTVRLPLGGTQTYSLAGVTNQGTTPPVVTCSLTASQLWLPNHDLVNVGLAATATDCGTGAALPVTLRVFSDEDELAPASGNFSPDAKNLGVGTLRLRKERREDADGRVYLIVPEATDVAGNVGFACCTVTVTHDQTAASEASVAAQAVAAQAFCQNNNGAAPAGYFVIGNGPVVGPKQ